MDRYLETEKLVIIYYGCYPREWEKISMHDFTSLVSG
jgi:hypothetical protein